MTVIAAYIIAIAIPAFIVYLFVALDIFGTGKASTVIFCLAWGMIGAFGLAYVINTLFFRLIDADTVKTVTAPVIEEILKSLFLIYLVRQPRFRYIVDGAVYGITIGMGFGLSENLFVYLQRSDSAILGMAISRTLSTALMHATASGMVGLALGNLRRARTRKIGWPVLGIGLAILLHVIYNNLVGRLGGMGLLLVAMGIGIGGSVMIAVLIGQGLAEEKRRFAETLGLNVGVSTGERKAVQRIGGQAIEQIFGELDEFFGAAQLAQVRRLLVLQANVGILQNNLNSPVSPRLRQAWEEEIAGLRAEIERVRHDLGASVRLFLQSVFPADDVTMQDAFSEEIGAFDPTLVHTFDMFMRVSELAETFTPDQLVVMAERLSRIEIFSNVSLANLENLSRAISVQNYDGGYMLFDQGDNGDAMYLIEEGSINIFAHDKTVPLRAFKPGDVVGEFSLLDGQPRSARAITAGPVCVLMLQREVFTMFIRSRPQVVLAMLQYLADKARYTTQAVETAMNCISRITQGQYDIAVAAVPVSDEPLELEPSEISEETPVLVSTIFSQAAATLQEREQSIRMGQAGA